MKTVVRCVRKYICLALDGSKVLNRKSENYSDTAIFEDARMRFFISSTPAMDSEHKK
jgi:hypothetical protein